MLEHKTVFTEPPTADRFLRCPDMKCRKVGFSADDSVCTCGAALVHATLSEITSDILLRRTAKIETLRKKSDAAGRPGFLSFSNWALRFGVDSLTFKTCATVLMRDRAYEKHVIALDSSGKRFICDAEFSAGVIREIAERPNKQRRTSARLLAALSAMPGSVAGKREYGSAD